MESFIHAIQVGPAEKWNGLRFGGGRGAGNDCQRRLGLHCNDVVALAGTKYRGH